MPAVIPPDVTDELEYARSLDIEKLASGIARIGFRCNGCATCCTRQDDTGADTGDGGWADNAVVVYPFEVRRIMEVTGLSWHEVAVPPSAGGDIDSEGRVHTFEWHLRQKRIPGHGNRQDVYTCLFLEHGRCTIYESRPLLCRTYPFYMSEKKLCTGTCEGLGAGVDARSDAGQDAGAGIDTPEDEYLKLAQVLKERYMEDMNQMIMLLERFEPYTVAKDRKGRDVSQSGEVSCKTCGGIVEYVVHDSEGAHMLSIQQE